MLEFLQNLFKSPKIERPSEWQVYEANKLKSLILQEKYEKLNKINKIRLELLKSKYDDPDENFSTKEIASKLNISEKTARNHISNTMQKLGVKGRSGAVVELLRVKELSL